MPSQNFENSESPTSSHEQSNKKMRDAATAAFGKASETAHDAREKTKRAAADVAATMSDQVMGVLNEQLSVGAQSVNRLAGSMRVAADDLARENPFLPALSGDLRTTWTITLNVLTAKRLSSWHKMLRTSRGGSRR